ncbi:FHA domain-containing protein [Paenibacillus sp. FSL W8-0919]|uniref:FHA domain-containing protein n=1 Tax=Paenibacillus sp. FSL W8-0919 TaxID=2954707 RepID=UPI0030FB9B1F
MRDSSGLAADHQAQGSPKRSGWLIAMDLAIAALSAFALIYVFVYSDSTVLQWTAGIVTAAILTGYIVYYARKRSIPSEQAFEAASPISKLILLNEEGERTKEWYIQGETSLLIGKSSADGEADVDLSDAEYASLISRNHAVLNRVAGLWYIEDVESRNGTGIQRGGKGSKTKLEPDKPCKIDPDDIIYIANTRLMVK